MLPVILVLVAAGTYANSLNGPFIFDDLHAVVGNEHIRRLWPLSHTLSAPPQSPVSGRPVVSLTLAINFWLGGLYPAGYHVLNISVHVLCALALFGIIRQTLQLESLRGQFGANTSWIALACALIWMAHPLQTECVNYITQRIESIMGLFYLLTLYCAIRGVEHATRPWWHGASILCCGLGMASKEVMVTAPLMVLLYDRIFVYHSGKLMWQQRMMLYLGLVTTWAVLAALMWWGPRSQSVGFGQSVSGLDYALNQCIMIVHYVRLAIWPHPLALDYGLPESVSILAAAPYMAALLGMLTLTVLALWRWPRIGFLGASFLLILGPTSSFVPISTEVGAERRMYLPLASLVVLGVLVASLVIKFAARRLHRGHESSRVPNTSVFSGLMLVLFVSPLIGATVHRNGQYGSELSIWQSAVDARPNNYRVHNQLGVALKKQYQLKKITKHLEQSGKHLRRAIDLRSDYADAHSNLGVVLALRGDLTGAIHHLRQAVTIDDHFGNAYNNLGLARYLQGHVDEAIQHYRRAIELGAGHANTHSNLATALADQGNTDQAVKHYREALWINPGHLQTHLNLAKLFESQNRLNDAIHHFEKALQLDPELFAIQHQLNLVKRRNATNQPDRTDQKDD